MSEELAARLMARIAVPPMPFAPDTYAAGRMDQFTEMITQLRALPEATGPQAERSGAIDDYELARLRGFEEAVKIYEARKSDPDLITIELTPMEVEVLIEWMDATHPAWDEDTDGVTRSKLRAALKGNP